MSKKDHRKEHEGCDAVFPWLLSCSRYKSRRKLVEMCLEDVKTMEPERFEFLYRNNREYHDVAHYKSSARSAYIAIIEGWREDEYEHELYMANWSKEQGYDILEGKTPEEYAKHMMWRKQQGKALDVLYAYGMFNHRTGKIELDRLNKLR